LFTGFFKVVTVLIILRNVALLAWIMDGTTVGGIRTPLHFKKTKKIQVNMTENAHKPFPYQLGSPLLQLSHQRPPAGRYFLGYPSTLYTEFLAATKKPL